MSCSVNVNQILTPPNTLVIQRQEDAGDPGSIVTTNIIITDDRLAQIEVVDVCRGTQGPEGPAGPEGPQGPPGQDGVQFEVLPIISGGTNNTSFNADYIIYYDGANDQLASTNYTIQDILNGVQALTGIVEGSGIQTTDLGNNQTRIDTIVGYGLDVDPTSNAIYLTGVGEIQPNQLAGILPINKGGTANTVYSDGKLIAFDASALNGSGQFISATNLDVDDIVVSGNGFTLTAGSGLVNGGFVIIPNGTGRIDIPESADITVFADSFELSQTGTPGTYSKVTTDSKGRVTLGEQLSPSDIYNILGYVPWHSGNDGCGSQLDADMLCGQSGDYYLDATNITGVINTGVLPDIMIEGRYTKVDVNEKGLVTSGMQMTPQDIEDILGYDPVSPTGGVDFCGDVELHGSLFINAPTGCDATNGLLRVYDNLPMVARNNADISPVEPRGVSFVYGGGLISRTGSIAYYPTDDLVKVTTNMAVNNNGVDGGDSDDDFQDDINGGDANSTFPISNLTGTQRILLYKDTADELYVSRLYDQIVFGFKTFKDGIGVQDQVIIYDQQNPQKPPTFVGDNTLLNVNFNADLLDGEHGEYYLDAGNMTGVFDPSKVTFGFIEGTPNYIPKFFDNGVDPANSIRDSIMFQSSANNIVLEDGSSFVAGDTNNANVNSNANNVIAGFNNTVNSTSDSLIVGEDHRSDNSLHITMLGKGATNSEDRIVAHGNYGEGWIEGQISQGAFETRDTENVRIEHGQSTDFLMYLEGTTASSWKNLTPSVQLPDDHTIGFKVTMLMNSAFSTGVAEFEFLSGIVKNVTFRDPDDPTSILTETVVAQYPKKNEIYNNSYIHRYDYQLICTDLGEIQSEAVSYEPPPIKINDVNIENLPTTINLRPEQPDGYNATYQKDNFGALSIDIDPASITGNYNTNANGDILVYCNDHGLTVGTYTELTFDSFSTIALPDQRYLVTAVVDNNRFVVEKPYWKAEKQTNNANAVFTLLPSAILEKDKQMDFETVVDIVERSGVNLRDIDAQNYPEKEVNANTERARKVLSVDSNCLINDTPVILVHTTGSTDYTFSSGSNTFTGTGTLSYYDYTWEYFRKSESIRISGNGANIQYDDPNALTEPLFTEPNTVKYVIKPYTDNETYVYQNAYAGDLFTSLNSPPTGLTIEVNQPFSAIPDGSFVNIGAVVDTSGAVRVRPRQKKSATYQRVTYNTNELIDCVYTRYTNTSGDSAIHIYAEEYVDLGLLDRPYSFSLYDNQIGTNDNDKFKIVEDNDLYYLYTNVDMPNTITNYEIEIQALDHYGGNELIQKFNIAVADVAASQEEGLDNIILVNGGVVKTGTPADTFITVISGDGGYDPYVIFDQGYNSFSGVFTSGSSIVLCSGISKEYDTTTLYGDPCGMCTGVDVLVDFVQGPPNQTVEVQQIWCQTGLQATPLLNSSKVIYTYPAISQNSVRVGQKFSIGSVEYTVGSELPQTVSDNKYGFSASTSASSTTERIVLNPNIEWIEYTGLPSASFATPVGITVTPNDVFEPRVSESGLSLDANTDIELEFDEPVTNLILAFTGVQAANSQNGYILQENRDQILLEDGTSSLLTDYAYSNSGAIICDKGFIVVDSNLPVGQIVPNVVSFSGSNCDVVLCVTGTIDSITLSASVDQATTLALTLGELVPKTIDTSDTALIQIDTPYTGYNNNEQYIAATALITYTGTPIDSGNLPISGLKEGNVFFNCQENSSSGVYGYETTQVDYGACYVTGECQVYSARTTIDENGNVRGQASYRVTFDEDIYISQDRESYIQLTNWTPTDSNPERTIVPDEGHYPISVISDITNNSFIIPEEYAVALPVPGQDLSRVGTVSGEFDIYHPYKVEENNVLNHIPAQFLTIERIYNPPITNANYRPKDNLFEIMGITGSKIYTEDKLNYVLIEDNRPPYLDQKISGNYVTDSREFYASTSPFSNRLRDLTFDPENVRDLNYADAPWSLKDIYVLADYDSTNSRLTLYNVPTGIFRPLDTIQVSFNISPSYNNEGCNLFPIYHDVPAQDMYLYTGLPVSEPSGENLGNILFTLSDTPPEGWIVLDGSTYDREQYAALAQYLDFYRVLYSSGWDSGREGWTASTLPDFRKVTPVGQYDNTVTAFANMGEIIRDTGNKLLLETNRSNDFGQSDNIVGKWIMYTEGKFIDPRYPINFADSGTVNYVINNVDIQDNGQKAENFIRPNTRMRIDILQFLEPDIRMNLTAGEDEPNYVYMQHQPAFGTDIYNILEPRVLIDPSGCDFTDLEYTDQYKVYTPTNKVVTKLRYDQNGINGKQYSLVLSESDGMKHFDEDLGVAHLFTKQIYDFDAGITGNAWWPEGVLPVEYASDGPARTPLQYASGGNTTPTGWGTPNSPIIFEYENPIVPSEEIVFNNYTQSGTFAFWIKVSGEVTDPVTANTAIQVLTRKYNVDSELICRKINNPNGDGYVISDGNGGSQLLSIPNGSQVVVKWANGLCNDQETPDGTGTIHIQLYGGIYQDGRGIPVYIETPSAFHIRDDFRYETERNPFLFSRTVYQLPSVELKNNICGENIRHKGEWFTHPYKTNIDTLNVPKSYLEYGDEFKMMSINNNSNFSDNVTRILTKINATSETTNVSGLATSSDLCRFIPCTTDFEYTRYRKTIMWGEEANDFYPSIGDLTYSYTGYFPSGTDQFIDFIDVFPESSEQLTLTVQMFNADDLPFTGCTFTGDDDSWIGMAEYVGCTWQDQKTVTFEAFPNSVSLKVYMTECSGNVNFIVSQNGTNGLPHTWSDPLLTSAAYCPVSYENNTFKTIDTFWQSPFESCNTGLYQDRPRSATPFGLSLRENIGWTGICEFVKTVSGRMYVPENNNLYFHTYGGTTAHWPLDYKGSGTPTQQTGVYIIDDVPDFGAVNSCSSGLMCISISGWNNNPITGIPTVGDRENIGSNPIVIESNGVTGIVSNYGANKKLFFDFDDGLPQLSKVYNVVDYIDGTRKIVINAPYDSSVVNKSGLVFMIDNDENIKTHLNPNVDNEFNVYEPTVTPSDIFDPQINHFDLNTRRWKHLLHYDFDAIGTGLQEVKISISGTSQDVNIYPVFPTGLSMSGVRITEDLTAGFTDYNSGDEFTVYDTKSEFYMQAVTLYGNPPFTDNMFIEVPKVSISGIQDYEFVFDQTVIVDGTPITNYHGSGWNIGIKVNKTQENIDAREITIRAEDITGTGDVALSFNQTGTPEIIQSYTGYSLFGDTQWLIIYDTRNLELGAVDVDFELIGSPAPANQITYQPVRDNVLAVSGPVDSATQSATRYYNVSLVAKTGLTATPCATGTGLLVDLYVNNDWTPLEISLNNFRSFGKRGESGIFYLEPSIDEAITFEIPQPQGNIISQGGDPFEIKYENQSAISDDMGYIIDAQYFANERRYRVTMTPTGVDGEYYQRTDRFANQQLKITIPYQAYDSSNQAIVPTPSQTINPTFDTILYTGLQLSNTNPNTVQYYETDEPWTIQVKVTGGVVDHDPTNPPNVRIFNAPNKGDYSNNSNPIDCIITYNHQSDPGNTCWIVNATARRDVLGQYMPEKTGEFRLVVNADDGLTDYTTLNEANGINDQFVIIYNRPSGFINLPPYLYSVPSAPFFTHCDVLSTDKTSEPDIVPQNLNGISLNSIDYRFDLDFPLWQRAYQGTQGGNYQWDAKVDISSQGLITSSVKAIGDDKVQAVAKFETIEIESDQLKSIPFSILSVEPEAEESEQFPGVTGILVEQGKGWELTVTTIGGLQDIRYPPTILLNDMPTFCTGFNPLDSDANQDQQCIDGEPSFDGTTWTFKFSGQPSCDLLGIKPFDILALDTLPGNTPSPYIASDTFDGQFIYETGEFSVLGPEVVFTGELELYPQCDICYTGYVDFGPTIQEDLDCNAVTGIKTVSFSGQLPSGLDYEIFFPTTTNGIPISRGKGTGVPPTVEFPAPWDNLASGYVIITGCPTHFASGGSTYTEEALITVCNAVDDCEEQSLIFEDASEAFDPNIDFSYFYTHSGMVLTEKTGTSVLGGTAEVQKSYAPAAQQYNLDCGTRLELNKCRTYFVYYSGQGGVGGVHISGVYPEGQPLNNRIELEPSPNNYVFITGQLGGFYGRHAAEESAVEGFDVFLDQVSVASNTGTGLMVVEKVPTEKPKSDKLNKYFDTPFNIDTTKCIMGNGTMGLGQGQGETTKYGVRGQVIPRLSGQFVDNDSTFAVDDEYMSGLNLVEVNQDTNVPIISLLYTEDCYSTGYMRISGIIVPTIHTEITDPPPASESPYFSYRGQQFSLATRLSHGDTEEQRGNPVNRRPNNTLQWAVYNTVVDEQITNGQVQSSGAFTFAAGSTSGLVYAIRIYNEADFAPNSDFTLKNYSQNDYVWIHKGGNRGDQPVDTTFPPIIPTGFSPSGLHVEQNIASNQQGVAYGGYVIPDGPDVPGPTDQSTKKKMIDAGVPAIPYWKTPNPGSQNYFSADYLPSISGMVLSALGELTPFTTGVNVDRNESPRTGLIPVTDDYVTVGDRVHIFIGDENNTFIDQSYILTANELLGSPVTGVQVTGSATPYFGFTDLDATITKRIEVDSIAGGTGVVLYHPNISYNIGDIVTLEVSGNSSSLYTACNNVDLTIVDGDTSSMELAVSTTDNSWYTDLLQIGDSVTLNKQEAGEIYIPANSISAITEGQYTYTIEGTATTLYKDYNFRIVTCENVNHPVYTDASTNMEPKLYYKDYNMYVSKEIRIVPSSVVITGGTTQNNWVVRFNIEGGKRPVRNHSPRVMLRYGSNNLGTFCGFDRTVISGPPFESNDPYQDNRLMDEYDEVNDQLIVELKANQDFDWSNQSSITIVVQDETGEDTYFTNLPS